MTSLLAVVGFMIRLAGRADRRRLTVAIGLMLIGYLAIPAVALSLRAFVNAAIAHETSRLAWLALLIAVLLIFDLMMGHFAHLYYFECGELAEAALQAEV